MMHQTHTLTPTVGVLTVDFAALGFHIEALANRHWELMNQTVRQTNPEQAVPEFMSFVVNCATHFDNYRQNPSVAQDFLTTELFELYDADIDATTHIQQVREVVTKVLAMMPSTCYCSRLVGVRGSLAFIFLDHESEATQYARETAAQSGA
jgi:hypothetical protein